MSPSYDPAVQYERQQRRLAAEARRQEAEQRREQRKLQVAFVAARSAQANEQNADIAERVKEIESLILSIPEHSLTVDVESLKRPWIMPAFDAKGYDRPTVSPQLEKFLPAKPGFFASLFGGRARYERALPAAKQAFARAENAHEEIEKRRLSILSTLRTNYEQDCAQLSQEVEAQHAEIDQLARDVASRVPEAVVRFYDVALGRDDLPEGFPNIHRIGYVAESRELVVEREVPPVAVVPAVSSYRYVKAKDAIESSPRPRNQIKALYAGLIARLALRTLEVLARAYDGETVGTIVLSCFVSTTDPATGHSIRPCLLTVRVSESGFREIDLQKVEPVTCLRSLNAQLSPEPHELRPVRPIVDFNMVDPRFIATADVLSTLDTRPNIAELSPGEFEALITNLFSKMGLETRLTQASRDGGVDCVAWDMRPIVGGKVIVQAKRYKNTVGVSAVRDLYGTVMNEGAAKGILVTTSGYGKSSFEFAKNKPLELLPGSQLLYLLEQHAGIKAKIEFPDDWKDPQADLGEP